MTFRVGQKVVCVKDNPGPEIAKFCNIGSQERSKRVRRGCVYTIREIDTRGLDIHGVACLRFDEIVGVMKDTRVGPWESGGSFPASHFRPVVEKKTDISIFAALLTPNPQCRELVSSVNGENINTL